VVTQRRHSRRRFPHSVNALVPQCRNRKSQSRSQGISLRESGLGVIVAVGAAAAAMLLCG
jgi:hypothetical protein